MAQRKKRSRPYLMGGKAEQSRARATIADPPDRRVPEVRGRSLSLAQVRQHESTCARPERISRELMPAHLVLERWARTPFDERGARSGCPRLAQVVFDRATISRQAVPLPTSQAEMVDDLVRSSPEWARSFVDLRYRLELSVTQIAQSLGMRRRESVSPLSNIVLAYFLGRFIERGLFIPRTAWH